LGRVSIESLFDLELVALYPVVLFVGVRIHPLAPGAGFIDSWAVARFSLLVGVRSHPLTPGTGFVDSRPMTDFRSVDVAVHKYLGFC
jgi:hypothetical protein